MSRAGLLARLAARYARRHKGQTTRAILGLLVATTVLTTGLGMGESIATSLEEEALARFGPIDVVLRGQGTFDADLATRVAAAPNARAEGVTGAATLVLTGPVSNPRTGLAEAFATIRGVSAEEARTLGALPARSGGTTPEPGADEVVLSADLAEALGARPGDRIRLRAPLPGAEGLDADVTEMVGAAGVPEPFATTHTLTVRPDAVGLGAEITWTGEGGNVTIQATSPSGIVFANASAEPPLRLVVPPPVETGTWRLRIVADAPIVYTGGAGVGYLPASLSGAYVTLNLTLSGIAAEEGRAAITGRPAALVSLATLEAALGERGNATHAYYRVQGDPYRAAEALHDAIPQAERDAYEVRAEKAELLASAEEAGAEVTGFLLVMGGFTLLAAVLLAFTLFSALVEERRSELGIARALGLTIGEVALAMTLEGALYALAAALAGMLLGVGILAGLLALVSGIAAERGGPLFALHLSPGTLGAALAIGVLIPLATIGLASLRFARLDPARAIRGIPDDPRARRRTGLVVALALAALGALLSLGTLGRLVGIPILLAGLAVLAASRGRARLAGLVALGGVAHVAWTLYTFDDWPADAGEMEPVLTLARGGVLALGLAALAVASPRPYDAVLRLLGRAGRAPRAAFLALRYLVARRRPAGLTMAMIAIVVVIVTVMGTLFSVFSGAIPEQEAGYSVLGEAAYRADGFPAPLPPDVRAMVDRADFLPRHVEFRQAEVTRGGQPVPMEAGMRQFLGVTPDFAEGNEYTLAERAQRYATDQDAWRAVARGEALIMPEWALERNGIAAGEILTVQTAATPARDYVVAGAVESEFVFQTFLPAEHVRAMGFPSSTTIFVRAAEGADPDVLARRLTSLYVEEGITFTSIPEEIARVSANLQALVLVFEAFLALGLFVGLAATGFLAQRAVRERMRDIGTLRALGYEERDVKNAFLLENGLNASLGLLIGAASGLLVAHSIWWQELRAEDVPFRPPWLILLGFALAVLALAALATRGPAHRAAALPPAIAVRHVE